MGRAGVGKTSTVNHLLGRGVCVCEMFIKLCFILSVQMCRQITSKRLEFKPAPSSGLLK